MKKILFLISGLILAANLAHAQSLNWKAESASLSNLATLEAGYDFSMTTKFGYGRKLDLPRPLWLTLDFAIPMGNQLLDDFETRIGAQMPVYELNNWVLTAKVYGNLRRYNNDLARMLNFGTELSGVLGYYHPKWHVAAEGGFDKSISTHLKHTEQMKFYYPKVLDGWFMPSGGQWFYGIQASKTLKQNFQLNLRLGATNAEGKDENAFLPWYGNLGVVKTF